MLEAPVIHIAKGRKLKPHSEPKQIDSCVDAADKTCVDEPTEWPDQLASTGVYSGDDLHNTDSESRCCGGEWKAQRAM